MADFGDVSSTQTLTRQVSIAGSAFIGGATPPTGATIGSTPTVPALLFDAVAETATLTIELPPDMDLTVDPTLEIVCALVSTETNNDVLSWSYDYVAVQKEVTGKGPVQTSTTATSTTTVTTANGLAIGDVYGAQLVIDASDATNPLSAAELIVVEIHLTNITGVASIHVIAGHLHYTAKY